MSHGYWKYWGKARREEVGGGEPYHLLVYHSLDVAAVASVWWDSSPAIQNSFLKNSNELSIEQLKSWVLFFIALHDYGKFDIRFQRKAPKAWEALQGDSFKSSVLPTSIDCKTYDHGSSGLFWFDQDTTDEHEDSDDWMLQIVDLVD